jgi:hypothetical protein
MLVKKKMSATKNTSRNPKNKVYEKVSFLRQEIKDKYCNTFFHKEWE